MAMSTSNVGGLAGAIAAQVRQSGAAKVGTVGPHAWCNALKAVVIAAKYMEADMSGKSLAVVPVKHEIAGEEAHKLTETVGLFLHVRPLPEVPKPPAQPEIFSAGSTYVGLMAGLMAKVLRTAEVVTVGGMGATAVSSALEATIIAQGYMAVSLGGANQLVVVPSINEFQENGFSTARPTSSAIWRRLWTSRAPRWSLRARSASFADWRRGRRLCQTLEERELIEFKSLRDWESACQSTMFDLQQVQGQRVEVRARAAAGRQGLPTAGHPEGEF